MHTIMVVSGGFLLLGVCLLIGRMIGALPAKAALAFIPLWLVASCINMWVGVVSAGYTVAQEAPILLVVFGIPAVVAYLLSRRMA